MSVVDEPAVKTDKSPSYPELPPLSDKWKTFVILAGVILPAAALWFEYLTGFGSAFFVDILPTRLHFTLVALVPITNALAFWFCVNRKSRLVVPLMFLLGLSIGTAFVYSIQLLVLIPFSFIAIIAYGIGLAGLSPYFAFAVSVICARRIEKGMEYGNPKRKAALWLGILAAVGILGACIGASYFTMKGLQMASSDDEAKSAQGIRLIRYIGSESTLLRACYGLPTDTWVSPDRIMMTNMVDRNKARDVYYRVTGRSFNSVPPPRIIGPRASFISDSNWDSDVGGTAVNSRVKDLSLISSRMDGIVDPDGLVSYTEWTLVFKNTSPDTQREARAEIALPPDGVVSRLTLWVEGEPREAAFSTRGKVRDAYQNVAVVQRRDPVLVTTCGPDRVLMQCFPVPPEGGTMKVRLGITAPLQPESLSEGTMILPRFIERNFRVSDSVKHMVYFKSSDELGFLGDGLNTKNLRAALTDRELAGIKNEITCERNPNIQVVLAFDPTDDIAVPVTQVIKETTPTPPEKVTVVIDGSIRLANARDDIAQALSNLPETCEFSVIQAAEQVNELVPMQKATPKVIRKASDKIRSMKCLGGVDNRPALLKAYESVMEDNGTILWIHGPQPIVSDNYKEQLLQICERQPGSLKIISVAVANGRNSILADLEHTGAVTVLPRRGTLTADLKGLFDQWSGKRKVLTIHRYKDEALLSDAKFASPHVTRLFIKDEVERICSQGDDRKLAEASDLAAKYQLVTAVSGAVVLENQSQYEDAGLQPVDPSTVPSAVPEPASIIALAAGAALVVTGIRRKRS